MGQKTRLLALCRIAATIVKETGFFALAGTARSNATDTPISNLNRTSGDAPDSSIRRHKAKIFPEKDFKYPFFWLNIIYYLNLRESHCSMLLLLSNLS